MTCDVCCTFSPSSRSCPGQSAYASGLPENASMMLRVRAEMFSPSTGDVKRIEKDGDARERGATSSGSSSSIMGGGSRQRGTCMRGGRGGGRVVGPRGREGVKKP